MQKKSRITAALVASSLLVGAAFVASAVSIPSTAVAQESTGDARHGRAFDLLSEVLGELVSDGTLNQTQADAVAAAVEDKVDDLRAERAELRELTKTLLEDGVLTSEEAEQLPEDHPLLSEKLDEAWEDGELTVEEIRSERDHPRRTAFRHGARLGALLDDGGIDQAEYDSLGDDHPLKSIDVSEYLDDGLITIDELREIRSEFRSSDDA